eukprot:gene9550-12112_t
MKKDSRLSGVLHCLLHMAEHDAPSTSEALAAAMQTNPVVVRRLMAGLRDAGRTPGQDVELVSRDGAYISDYLFPPLPTLFLDIRTVASTLCDFLLRRIQGEPAEGLQRVFPCELRYGELLRVSSDELPAGKVLKFSPTAEPVPNSAAPGAKLPLRNDSAH